MTLVTMFMTCYAPHMSLEFNFFFSNTASIAQPLVAGVRTCRKIITLQCLRVETVLGLSVACN